MSKTNFMVILVIFLISIDVCAADNTWWDAKDYNYNTMANELDATLDKYEEANMYCQSPAKKSKSVITTSCIELHKKPEEIGIPVKSAMDPIFKNPIYRGYRADYLYGAGDVLLYEVNYKIEKYEINCYKKGIPFRTIESKEYMTNGRVLINNKPSKEIRSDDLAFYDIFKTMCKNGM